MSLIELFWPALLMAVMLVFIHAVFGLEILRRGVIFTDLAIGQVAAVGMAVSIAFLHGRFQTPLTLAFALITAALIAYAAEKIRHVEAFIGLLYALGISGMMLILAQSSEGMELYNKLSAADILFSSGSDVAHAAVIYLPVAAVMTLLYPRLQGLAKELLFFAALAVTVTSSVQSAGVLMVFVLLIAPAMIGMLTVPARPYFAAVAAGSLIVCLAMAISYFFDLPTGYSVVFLGAASALVTTMLFGRKSRPA